MSTVTLEFPSLEVAEQIVRMLERMPARQIGDKIGALQQQITQLKVAAANGGTSQTTRSKSTAKT